MLTKLMKYEWKSIWRVLLIINAFTVIMTVIGLCTIYPPFFGQVSFTDESAIPIILSLLLYYITILGVSIAAWIYIAIRFYKNTYSNQGYLTHTLPVTPRQLLISRIVIHSIFYVVTSFLVMLSVLTLCIPLVLLSEGVSMQFTWQVLTASCVELFGMPPISLGICFLMIMIVGSISSTVMVYCAIAIGQTFQKHKVMASILCYVALYFLLQTVVSILILPQTISFTLNSANAAFGFQMGSYMRSILLISLVSSLISGIVFYIITEILISKKLNLD